MDEGLPPTVSVIMPTYNRASLLPASIASVLEQGFQDLELLVIDDGSTDETPQVIAAIQANDNRLHYYPLPENRGIGFARMTGVENARSRYIGFADSDDLWLPGKLDRQVAIMQAYPQIDILFGDFWNIDQVSGECFNAFQKTRPGLDLLQTTLIEPGLLIVNGGMEQGLLVKMFIQLGSVLMRTSVIKRSGNFNPQLTGSEDFEYCWRAAINGSRYAYTETPLIERHLNSSSVTANTTLSWIKTLEALEVCKIIAQEKSRIDLLPSLRRADQRAWRNIISTYGEQGDRLGVLRSYKNSLDSGFSIKNLIYVALAIIGIRALSLTLQQTK